MVSLCESWTDARLGTLLAIIVRKMSENTSGAAGRSQAEVEARIVRLLNDMVQDWDLDNIDGIGPATRIIEELEFESIDLIQLMVAVEKEFGVKGLPYESLVINNGAYIEELLVSEVAAFLMKHL